MFDEGDIVSLPDGKLKYIIVWDDMFASFVKDGINKEEGLDMLDYCDTHEIIGNIYENPDLLK